MTPEIIVGSKNRTITIKAKVKDSLHASLLSDRLNMLPYLKVFNREYKQNSVAVISAHAIPGIFTIQKLHEDLELMSDLIIFKHDRVQNSKEVK
jgi:hypothetical protein